MIQLTALATTLLLAGVQAPSQYPVVDQVAAKIIQEYRSSSCAQLAAERNALPNAQKAAMKDKVGMSLRNDPAMRVVLVNKVAPTVVDKMIVCGFLP